MYDTNQILQTHITPTYKGCRKTSRAQQLQIKFHTRQYPTFISDKVYFEDTYIMEDSRSSYSKQNLSNYLKEYPCGILGLTLFLATIIILGVYLSSGISDEPLFTQGM